MKIVSDVAPFHTDERGSMSHLIPLNTKITSCLLVTSRKGTVRANHYHKKDYHFVYVISGIMDYTYKQLKSRYAKTIRIRAGQLIYTPRNTIHRMKFIANTVFLALTTEKRSQKEYEKDTVRVQL